MPRTDATSGKRWRALVGAVVLSGAALFASARADAHFILVEPENWMSQDDDGLPLKLGPCGNEGGGTPTGAVTAFLPGQVIPITIDESVHHPGHYRVALSVNDRSELPAPPLVTPAPGDPCDSAAIQDPAVFPVLADGALAHTSPFAGPQTFMVTLPGDVTCTHCTLQVIEYMANHSAPCFYYHCADISIQGEAVACGDGELQVTEQCDDGNVVSGDGCDSGCRLECAASSLTALSIGRLAAPSGDEKLSLRGTLMLPLPVSPALDPLANGVRILVDGSGGSVIDVTIPAGAGWKVNAAATRWNYRDPDPAPTAIYKVVLQDQSAATPGLVRFALRGKAIAAAVTAGDLPLTARMILATSGGQCGDSSFTDCAISGSGNALRCE